MLRIKNIDQHYVVFLFGIRAFSIKYKHKNIIHEPIELGITEVKRDTKIIVSMTSFPERIGSAIQTLKTALTQTLKPDLVILWLAHSQFPNREKDLPKALLELRKFGLTIEWVDDLRSYKKLIPALKRFPNDIIITLDDDICYAEDTVETLYNSYLQHPNDVHAHRCGRIEVVGEKLINIPVCYLYDKEYYEASFLNRLTGHAGVLYPPHVFDDRVFDRFQEILPTHDDVWFWGMLVLNGIKTRVVKGFRESIYPIEGSQAYGLCKINNARSESGISINKAYEIMIAKFPEILDKLK